jgi:hypothetical protein
VNTTVMPIANTTVASANICELITSPACTRVDLAWSSGDEINLVVLVWHSADKVHVELNNLLSIARIPREEEVRRIINAATTKGVALYLHPTIISAGKDPAATAQWVRSSGADNLADPGKLARFMTVAMPSALDDYVDWVTGSWLYDGDDAVSMSPPIPWGSYRLLKNVPRSQPAAPKG